jgi:hypothetical protein
MSRSFRLEPGARSLLRSPNGPLPVRLTKDLSALVHASGAASTIVVFGNPAELPSSLALRALAIAWDVGRHPLAAAGVGVRDGGEAGSDLAFHVVAAESRWAVCLSARTPDGRVQRPRPGHQPQLAGTSTSAAWRAIAAELLDELDPLHGCT